MALGVIALVATMIAFSGTTSHFAFKGKEQTITEPVESGGTKETKETDYADTVTIFALTIGAAFVLSGAFYGRLRSLKLGDLELGLAGEEEKEEAAKQAADKVEQKVADKVEEPAKEAAKAAAQQVAVADLNKVAALGVELTEPVVAGIAERAASKVAAAITN